MLQRLRFVAKFGWENGIVRVDLSVIVIVIEIEIEIVIAKMRVKCS